MENQELEEILLQHPLFKEMSKEDMAMFADCGSHTSFDPEQAIFKMAEKADVFYLVREGRVAVQIQSGEEDPVVIQTLGPGEILGWSWIFPPYEWQFDAIAMDPVQALCFDARCIRAKLEDNPKLGYWLMQQFSQILMARLSAARIQVMDIYGH